MVLGGGEQFVCDALPPVSGVDSQERYEQCFGSVVPRQPSAHAVGQNRGFQEADGSFVDLSHEDDVGPRCGCDFARQPGLFVLGGSRALILRCSLRRQTAQPARVFNAGRPNAPR